MMKYMSISAATTKGSISKYTIMDALRLIATQQYYNVHNIIYQELSSHCKLFSLLENLYIYFRNKMQILFEENFRNRNKN